MRVRKNFVREEPAALLIRKPRSEDKGESVLFITRPTTNPFGTESTTMFVVHDIVIHEHFGEATTDLGPIRWSLDTKFIVVPRELVTALTIKEMAALQHAETVEWERANKKFEKVEGPEAGIASPVGADATHPSGAPIGNYR